MSPRKVNYGLIRSGYNVNPPRWVWYVFGLVFFIVGSVLLYFLGVRPVLGVMRASGWVETPCTVIASELKEHPSDDADSPGPSYSIEIVYEYDFGGKPYRSDQYDFLKLSSNTNVATRSAIVQDHWPGKQTTCYVNPSHPAEAVLQRGWTAEMWWGLFPIPFVLIGVFGLLKAVRG
jgi:hypothetical protein